MDLIHNSIHGFYKYYCDIKNFDNLSLGSKYSFLAKLFNYLAKFSALKTQKEKTKNEKWMCIIQLKNYVMTCQKHILMNTMIYQMQLIDPNYDLANLNLANMTIVNGIKN